MTITSAELLSRISRLSVYQPGVTRWRVSVRKISGHTYKVTLRLKSSGAAGTVKFKISGRDSRGGSQSTRVAFPIH